MALILLVAALMGLAVRVASAQRYEDFTTPTPLAHGDYLVIGFQGGRRAWDDESEGVRRLALKLRAANLPGVHVETVENRRRDIALQLVHNALDRNRDGQLDPQERASARIIVYGQSFGGAAVVKFARHLAAQGIPVLLTVQIDSVGRDDALIPPNVRRAANLYQSDGLLIRGEPEIRAQDPAQTTILGNFLFSYKDRKVDLSGVPWYRKIFRADHSRMNIDPEVWAKVEELIGVEIRPPTSLDTVPSER
ncbi:MAG TPA: hypothetical protein VNN18_10845 [Candidatus Xenobia bacterium]|nr:hypothetical protein [Candidatus Xenobia bacterium]